MKKIMVLAAGVLLIGVHAHAGSGDLFVKGKVGVGTKTPAGRLEICDGGACVKWTRTLGNYGSDTYGAWSTIDTAYDCDPIATGDTCDGDNQQSFECGTGSRSQCTDIFTDRSGAQFEYYIPTCQSGVAIIAGEVLIQRRDVTCKEEYRMLRTFTDEIISP